MCRFYAPRLAGKCREERAEEVRDKEHANFCDWFKPRPDAHRPPDLEKSRATKTKLDAMFGGGTDTKADTARAKLDELLGGKDKGGK